MSPTLRVLFALCLLCLSIDGFTRETPLEFISLADLPREARETLKLIKNNGPFPYQRDSITFNNFEKRLPLQPRGYYREFTVPTPGLKHRGARRIVSGKPGEYYYTDDHYRSFKRIRE